MTNKSWYYKKIKRWQQLQEIMEALKNIFLIMARTGKWRILVKYVLEWVADSGSLLLHWEANANLRQLLSTTMNIRKIFRADKNDGLEVTTATIIIANHQPNSSPRLSLFSQWSCSCLPKLWKDYPRQSVQHMTPQEQAARRARDAEMSSPCPHSRTQQWDVTEHRNWVLNTCP